MTKSLPHSFDDILLRHAAGVLDAGFSLLVETHLEMSPAAREVHAQFEALGGVLLEEIAPAEVDVRSADQGAHCARRRRGACSPRGDALARASRDA